MVSDHTSRLLMPHLINNYILILHIYVLCHQQVTKELLVQYGKQFDGSKVKAVVANVKDIVVENLKTR